VLVGLNATVALLKPAVTDVIFGAPGAVTVPAPADAPFNALPSPVATSTTPQSQAAQPRGRARPLDVPIIRPPARNSDERSQIADSVVPLRVICVL
jgi:hypothetical protein